LAVKGPEIDLFTDEILFGFFWRKPDDSSVSANLNLQGMRIEDIVADQNKFLSKLKEHRQFILRFPTVLDSFDASPEDRKQLIDFATYYSKLMQDVFSAFRVLNAHLQNDS
jgi:hypothetical protein